MSKASEDTMSRHLRHASYPGHVFECTSLCLSNFLTDELASVCDGSRSERGQALPPQVARDILLTLRLPLTTSTACFTLKWIPIAKSSKYLNAADRS